MPENPNPKLFPRTLSSDVQWRRDWSHPYAELDVLSNFSFLRGASDPHELVGQAAELGHRAIAITDLNSVAGVVRAHVAAKEIGIPLCIGSRFRFVDAPDVLVWAENRAGYANLCQLLTLGKGRAPKGECRLFLKDLCSNCTGLWVALTTQPIDREKDYSPWILRQSAVTLKNVVRHRLSIAVSRLHGIADVGFNRGLALSQSYRIPLLATNQVHYHDYARRPLQDVLTCVRHGCVIQQAGYRLFANAERCLKKPVEMHHLFRDHPAALRRSVEVAEACRFCLDEIRYEYPKEVIPVGKTPDQHLADLTWAGAAERYPTGVPTKIRMDIEKELVFIRQQSFPEYFLTLDDVVRFARSKGILCQGRGSAANSAVCYCLGITSVNPDKFELLFERFLSTARKDEPPDIDVDFEHERREEVIQYIYEKYGRDRAAMTASLTTYRGRSAVRDVGKALGLSLDVVEQMAKRLDWWDDGTLSDERAREIGLDPGDYTVRQVLTLSTQLLGFPRHLSQHVGGMVISNRPLCEIVPIENAAMDDRTVIEWDKDDLDTVNIMKIDILALGMLTALSKGMKMISDGQPAEPPLQLHTIPQEDPGVYQMLQQADSVGVFQVESRAQMSMLPRLKPAKFYDLVIEVAIVRPGPIQGDMVHPYLRRRDRHEKVEYPKDELIPVLERTLGVPLFQEQAMKLVMVAAKFTAERADRLRKAMASWKFDGDIEAFHKDVVQGMTARGYEPDFAERVFKQIKGFSGYGFPESHAASFANLVYASSWIKRYHPAAFCAALLNSQPMGFYAPAQLVRDAREHGVQVRSVDVNHSDWDCTLEPVERGGPASAAPGDYPAEAGPPRSETDPRTWGSHGPAVRLGFRMIKGMSEAEALRIMQTRAEHGPFDSTDQFHARTRLPVSTIMLLAQADAFNSLDRSRRPAVWDTLALPDERLPLNRVDRGRAPLPQMLLWQEIQADYSATTLSLKGHPVKVARAALRQHGVLTAEELKTRAHGSRVKVAGLVLIRQRPGTAAGIVFVTLEDETGVVNLIIRPAVYEQYRLAARYATLLQVDGILQRQNQVQHVLVDGAADWTPALNGVEVRSRDFH